MMIKNYFGLVNNNLKTKTIITFNYFELKNVSKHKNE